jgi:mRNA-degrading endonuclease RelE of RelBE toxin-antitoxin system
MKILETSKFHNLRKKLKEDAEKNALKAAIEEIEKNPQSGRKLRGEFGLLRSYQYAVKGQSCRLIYTLEKDLLVLFSFGPREGIFK